MTKEYRAAKYNFFSTKCFSFIQDLHCQEEQSPQTYLETYRPLNDSGLVISESMVIIDTDEEQDIVPEEQDISVPVEQDLSAPFEQDITVPKNSTYKNKKTAPL